MPLPAAGLAVLWQLLQELVPLLARYLLDRLDRGVEARARNKELILTKEEKVREIVNGNDLGRLGTILRGKFRLQDVPASKQELPESK